MPSTARPAPTRVVSDVGGAALDAAFTLLGLVARPYLINGRQYHGRQGEFDLHVYVTTVTQSGSTGRAGYAGHDLTLCLVAPSHTRLSVSWNAGVAAWIDTRFRGRTAVPLHAAALEGLHVRAVDAAWAARFVESTATSLAALMTLPKGCGMVTFELQPGAMQFGLRCHWTTVSPALVATWVEHLHALASVIATLPAPEPRIVETSRDRHMVVRDEAARQATTALAVLLAVPALAVTLASRSLLWLRLIRRIWRTRGALVEHGQRRVARSGDTGTAGASPQRAPAQGPTEERSTLQGSPHRSDEPGC